MRLVENEENVIVVTYGKCKCGPSPTNMVTNAKTIIYYLKNLFIFIAQNIRDNLAGY